MQLRTIAIIAHVDHGKTTLLDALLQQTHTFRDNQDMGIRIMDSNPLEKERGITILAKNTSIVYKDTKLNIVDTPGHADFSSEVERVLKMVDAVLLLVDAKEGPMPQTRFVTRKALALGLKPIVVVNKIDKKDARPAQVVDMTFDLFVELGATDAQLDFPVVYTVAKAGTATRDLAVPGTDIAPLLDLIMETVPPYPALDDEPLQAQVYNLDYDNYLGGIAIAKVFRGTVRPGAAITMCGKERTVNGKIGEVFIFHATDRVKTDAAQAGELVAITGLPDPQVGETIADAATPEALTPLTIDEPTLTMRFLVNDSPFAGREGKLVTTRHIRDRLIKEMRTNVGLRVTELSGGESYEVAGRGELHLAILLETMRREGFEVQVSKPEVIMKEVDGVKMEPYEQLFIEVNESSMGSVMEKLGQRKAVLKHMHQIDKIVQLEFIIPTRSLLGFRSEFTIDTRGEGIMYNSFTEYGPVTSEASNRRNGVLISGMHGVTTPYSLNMLQERGTLFIDPTVEVYEGMVIGESARAEDMTVNPTKEKQLTNMRASGKDKAVMLQPARRMTLEMALEYITENEYVEITPENIRIRKKWLKEHERKKWEK